MAKARRGRARFVTNDRATVRTYREGDVDKIDTPRKLVSYFERQLGYEVRITGNSHFMVYGPRGATMTIPQKWGDPRGRENTLADARRAGFLPSKGELIFGDGEPGYQQGPDLPKLVADGGRPTLTYVKEEEEMTVPTDQFAKRNDLTAYAKKEDLSALTELVTGVASKAGETNTSVRELWTSLEQVVTRLVDVEAKLASGSVKVRAAKAPLRRDYLAEVRQEVLNFLKPFGPDVKFPLAFVVSNLYDPENDRSLVASSYMNQLKKLVADGLVVQHKFEGDRSGAKTMYSLAPAESA